MGNKAARGLAGYTSEAEIMKSEREKWKKKRVAKATLLSVRLFPSRGTFILTPRLVILLCLATNNGLSALPLFG